MPDKDYLALAFVSGKGGVGKTTLATNTAWLFHGGDTRVMVIDLDFQNLGATGLFSGLYKLHSTCAFDLLHNPPGEKPPICEIDNNLFFLPGAFTYDSDSAENTFAGVFDRSRDIRLRLEKMLDALHEWYGIDCFVIDCHGGIDSTSIAAAGVCDRTLVVTEADSVTFSGTLALIDSYLEHYRDSSDEPRVEFIVNRIPAKYRWKDLDKLYSHYLEQHLGRYTPHHRVLSFIPSEKFLADSFGDYPFQVQLAPNSLFCRKLMLMIYQLCIDSHSNLIDRAVMRKMQHERRRHKIYSNITSAETRGVQQVFTAFSLAALYAMVVIPVLMIQMYTYAESAGSGSGATWSGISSVSAFVLAGVGFIVIVFWMIRASWNVCGYFRGRLKFQVAFYRVLPSRRSVFAKMELWKLRVFFLSSAFGAAMLSFYMIAMVFGVGVIFADL